MRPYPILYSFRRCPYAMRARMAVMQSGVTCELREVVLRDKPAAMLELSPKGTVPVLQLPDNAVLEESLDIMHWVLAANDPENWLDMTDASADLISQLDGSFKNALDRYKYFVNHPERPQSDYRDEGTQFLSLLEEKLAENGGAGLSAPRITFSDIAVFPFARQFAFVDKAWFDEAPYPLLQAWLSARLDSSLFLSVMSKYPAWKPGDDVLLFGGTKLGSVDNQDSHGV
jgi:glutathione S-transferase